MEFITRSEINTQKWDALVEKNGAHFYSYSWFMDACASEWMVLVDNQNYDNGIAINYSTKMGISFLHPPMFVQTTDFLGTDFDFQQRAMALLQQKFPIGVVHANQQVTSQYQIKTTQIQTIQIQFNKLGKRMVNKAVKSGLHIRLLDEWRVIFDLIQRELKDKIEAFTPENIQRLMQLVEVTSDRKQLRVFGIFEANELVGGMLFTEFHDRLYYIKGAALSAVKKNGGMYACMQSAIDFALENGKCLDFGGSSVEGVRNFNLNFGASDNYYFVYQWNNAPFWYNWLRGFYHFVQKSKGIPKNI